MGAIWKVVWKLIFPLILFFLAWMYTGIVLGKEESTQYIWLTIMILLSGGYIGMMATKLDTLVKALICFLVLNVGTLLAALYQKGNIYIHAIIDTVCALVVLACAKMMSYASPHFINMVSPQTVYVPFTDTACRREEGMEGNVTTLDGLNYCKSNVFTCILCKFKIIDSLLIACSRTFYIHIRKVPDCVNPFNFLQGVLAPLILIMIGLYAFWPSLASGFAYCFPAWSNSSFAMSYSNFGLLPIVFSIIFSLLAIRFCAWFQVNWLYSPNLKLGLESVDEQQARYLLEHDPTISDNIKKLQENAYTWRNVTEFIFIVGVSSYFIFLALNKLLILDLSVEFIYVICLLTFFAIAALVLAVIHKTKKSIVRKKGMEKFLTFFAEPDRPFTIGDVQYENVLIESDRGEKMTDRWVPPELPLTDENRGTYQIFYDKEKTNIDLSHITVEPRNETEDPVNTKWYMVFSKKVLEEYVHYVQRKLYNEGNITDLAKVFDDQFKEENLAMVPLKAYLLQRYVTYVLPIGSALLFAYIFTKVNRSFNSDPAVPYDDRDMLAETFLIFLVAFLALFFLLESVGMLEKKIIGFKVSTIISFLVIFSVIPVIIIGILEHLAKANQSPQ